MQFASASSRPISHRSHSRLDALFSIRSAANSATRVCPVLSTIAERKRALEDLPPTRASAAPRPGCPQRAVPWRPTPASARPRAPFRPLAAPGTHLPRHPPAVCFVLRRNWLRDRHALQTGRPLTPPETRPAGSSRSALGERESASWRSPRRWPSPGRSCASPYLRSPALQRVALLCGIPEVPADEPGCPPFRPPSSCVDAQPCSGRRPGSPRDLRLPGGPDPGEPRAPPAACCPPTEATSTSSPRDRSSPLACPAPLLAAMEGDAGHRPARDRHPLASRGVQAVMALDVAAPRWTTEHNGRGPRPRSPDGR